MIQNFQGQGGAGDVFFWLRSLWFLGRQVPRGVECFFVWMVEMVGWVLGKLMSEGTKIKEATGENKYSPLL